MPMRISLLVLLSVCLCAAGPATQPAASPPARPTAPAADAATMTILNRLEASGKKYPNVTADIHYLVDEVEAGDTSEFKGKVYYQSGTAKTPVRFRIHFKTRRQSGGPETRHVEDYVFDGSWLTVRKQRVKQFTRYQVAAPGQRINTLELGRGPFPVPFGQKTATVLKYFAASTRPPAKDDPPGTDYLNLVTRPRHARKMSMRSIGMWVDRQSGLPIKIVAVDKSANVSTVVFVRKTIKTPRAFPKGTFDLPTPRRSDGWSVSIEKYAEGGIR